jgi:pimeloyl-ACP methyl ester carboxylesterase
MAQSFAAGCDAGAMTTGERVPYDEFSMFHENADEFGLPYDGPPVVRREAVEVEPGRHLSALVWGDGEPELVFLHGGAQNAHTWDTVALALARPLLAVDLPGHGHSDGGLGNALDPASNARDVATVIRALAPNARTVVGMSLGGVTAIALAALAPELVRSLVLVDITPGVDEHKASAIVAFVNGPESFDSFDDLLARTIAFNPTRSEASLRRGILHNALQREDGSWVWRYARHRAPAPAAAAEGTPATGDAGSQGAADQAAPTVGHPEFGSLWDAVSGLAMPVMLVRGMLPQSVVDDADEAELVRRCRHARIEHVADAGHSVQGDQPVELARLIADFAAATP